MIFMLIYIMKLTENLNNDIFDFDLQRRHKYILNYFSKKVPEEVKGRFYYKVMDYIENNPQVVSNFDDNNFFSLFHRTLIRNSSNDVMYENTFPHYFYGRSFSLEDGIETVNDFDLEKKIEENHLFEGIEISVHKDDNFF